MDNNLTLFFVMAAGVGLLIGLSKGGLGGLMGSLATPLMALVMPPSQVVGLLLPMLMFADVFAVASYWKRWRGRLVLLLPGGVAGVTIGTLFITNAPTETLRNVLAWIVLIFTLYKVFEPRLLKYLSYRPRTWHGLLAGTIAGFASTLAHAGGPPAAIYLLMQGVDPVEFIATNALFFAILNWIKVPYYAYAGLFNAERLLQVLWLMPIIPVGVLIGRWAAGRINKLWFERIIITALFVTAVMLLLE